MKSAKYRFLEPYGGLSKTGGEWGVNLKIPEGGRVRVRGVPAPSSVCMFVQRRQGGNEMSERKC